MNTTEIKSRIFYNNKGATTFFLLFVQHSLAALSIYFLAGLARSVALQQYALWYLYVYFAFLLLSHVIGTYAAIYLEKWRLASIENFTNVCQDKFIGKVDLFPDRPNQNKMVSLYSKVGVTIVSSYVEYMYQLASATLLSFATILIVSFVVDSLLLLSYTLSVIICTLIILKFQRVIRVKSYKSERKMLSLTGVLSSVWDNLVIGNILNKSAWMKNKKKHIDSYKTAKMDSAILTNLVQLFLSLSAFLPSIFLVIFLIQNYGLNNEATIVLLVSLPKIIQVLNSMTAMTSMIAQYNYLKGTFLLIEDFLNDNKIVDLNDRIKFENIKVSGAPGIGNIEGVHEWYKMLPKTGRVTIQANNGSGKTSLLLTLKKYFGDRSFYLPAIHNLSFNTNLNKASTGERVIQIIDELLTLKDIDILLLDEWDANLDKTKMETVSRKIEDLVSSGKMVVEVRHKL